MTTADLRPAEYNIHEVAGADLSIVITCYEDDGTTPLDVSGYTFAADVLRSGAVVDSFATAVTGDDDNILTLTLTDTETAAIGTGRGLEWALKVTAGGLVDWWYGGEFRLYNAGTPRESSSSNSVTAVVGGSITAALTAGVPANDAVLAGFVTDSESATRAALDAQYAPLEVDQFVDPFPTWFGGGTVNEAIADIVTNQDGYANTIVIPAKSFEAVAGPPSMAAYPANRAAGWQFDASVSDRVWAAVFIPAHWATMTFTLVWANAGAGSGDVFWQVLTGSLVAGVDLNTLPTAIRAVTATAGAAGVVVESTTTAVAVPNPGGTNSIAPNRLGAEVTDTLGNDCALYAVVLTRAS